MKTAGTTIMRGILVTVVLAGLATSGMAQFANQSAIRDVVRRIQTRTDSLQRAAQNAADRNAYRVDDLNRLVSDFEIAVPKPHLNSRHLLRPILLFLLHF